MKNVFAILLFSLSINSLAIAQTQEINFYDNQKVMANASHLLVPRISGSLKINEADPCNCWIERDSSWSVVEFSNGTAPEFRNDDGSTVPFTLPFNFCFYGFAYTDIYINNNGNVSFDAPFATFSADSFPSPNFKMIAPFWGDCDTRNVSSGIVYYKLTSTALIIQWDHVGYYSSHVDKLNAFQLILTEGTDQILDAEKNIGFCYQDMQWTTGDASVGAGGFGGTPAIVGINKGDGINSVQIGRFDSSGSFYIGPYGGAAGIDFLDNQSYTFSSCDTGNFAPFLKYSGLCDTLEICIGDTAIVEFEFYSPEQNQITSTAFNFFGLTGCSVIQNVPGNISFASASIIGQVNNSGYHVLTITGTDNGTPQQSFTSNFLVHIKNVNAAFTISPSVIQIGDTVMFTAASSDNTYNIWSFDDGSPDDTGVVVTHIFTTSALFDVTLNAINDGCQTTTSTTQQITVLFVGIDENNNSNLKVSLSPNPTHGVLIFNAKDNSKTYSIEISDMLGRIVFHEQIVNANQTVDISYLENGIYFYKISDKEGEVKGQYLKL